MSIDALRAIQSLLPDVEVVQSDAPADDSNGGAYSEAPCIAAAAIRVRVDRRFTTWRNGIPVIARRLYMPVAFHRQHGLSSRRWRLKERTGEVLGTFSARLPKRITQSIQPRPQVAALRGGRADDPYGV